MVTPTIGEATAATAWSAPVRRGTAATTSGPLTLTPGRITGLMGPPGFGLTRVGLSMLAPAAQLGTVAVLDVRGWFSPAAAWEAGIDSGRLVVVRSETARDWGRIAATLVEGVRGLYAEVPAGVNDSSLRRLAALVRTRRTPVVLRPVSAGLPSGVAHLRLEAEAVSWEGTGEGHGRLMRRTLLLRASGKGMGGTSKTIEVEDDGADLVRVVSRVVATQAGRAAG